MSARDDRERLLRLDAETRERAQREFDRPMLVEAGAGTGKTTVLVARIVAWSLGPGWERAVQRTEELGIGSEPHDVARRVLSRVVAITFTEAAAAEMELRTSRAFRQISAGDLPVGVIASALPEDEVRRQRAAALAEALAHLEVCTIHAFCRRILAAHPLEAGLHPAFQVDADGRAQQEAVREAIEQAIRSGYGEDGDPDLVALAIDGAGPAELEEALIELVAQGVGESDLDRDPFSPEALERFFDVLEAGIDAFADAGVERVRSVKRARKPLEILDALDRMRQRLASADVDAADGLSDWLVDFEDSWSGLRAHLMKWGKDDFGTNELDALGEEREALCAAARGWVLLLDHCLRIDPKCLERARRVLRPMLAQVHAELRRRGFCSYSGLLSKARALLMEDAEVRANWQSSIDQLLVDEFQDTDPDQCEIVAMLALEGPEDRRPGLFLVGDPKQSIYGWRRADLRAYENFVARAAPDARQRGRLSKNFRSLPLILDEVERVVNPVMRENPGVQPRFERLIPSEERCDASPPAERAAVEHWISWDRETIEGAVPKTLVHQAAELEAAALARDLRDLGSRDDFRWRDAAVLFRGSGDLEVYLQALREAGVPYAVERERTFYQRREVIDAAAFVRCVLDPDDQLALLTTLRSSAVGVPDAALLPLWAGELPRLLAAVADAPEATLPEIDSCIESALTSIPDDIPGIERVGAWDEGVRLFARVLAALRRSFDTDPVDVFVEKLRRFSLLEVTEASRFLGEFRVANLDRFFREVLSELDGASPDVQELLRRLRRGVLEETEAEGARPSEAVDDAVRVMTIHKAKGLDFKHTYIVQTHKTTGRRVGQTAKPVEAERVFGADGHFEYSLLGAPTPGFHVILEHRAQREAAERVRTLYVAMTRAADRLVLLGNWDRPTFDDEAKRKSPEAAESFSQLAAWRDGLPHLPGRATDLAAAGTSSFEDEDGVHWRFLALASSDETVASDEGAADDLVFEPPGSVEKLRQRRSSAALRMAVPFQRIASDDAPHFDREEEADRRSASEPSRGATRDARRVAGTAVHRVLEDLDLETSLDESLALGRSRLPAIVAALTEEAGREAAVAHATEVFDRLESSRGAVLDRLSGLGDRCVARELSVLLPPAEGSEPDAVGFVVGSLDLVYRDPDTDRLVVVDFKTDEVNDPRDLDEKKRRYASQGAVYQRALREALALDYTPRFELWMLWSGDVVSVA